MFVEINKRFLDYNDITLPFVVTTYGKKTRDYANRPYGFKHHHLLWVTDGRGMVEAGGQHFELSAGEGFFVKRGVPHSYHAVGDCFSTVWLTFIAPAAVTDHFSLPDMFRFDTLPCFEPLVHDMDRACADGDVFTRSAVCYSWFIEWMTERKRKTLTVPSRIRQLVENKFAEPLSLYALADSVGIDRFALCRAYKKEYGVTISDDIKRIRIDKAKQLLRFSLDRIDDVGKSCGYESPSYFCKVFREITGMSPRQYREQHTKK